jgi:hypothetical protein
MPPGATFVYPKLRTVRYASMAQMTTTTANRLQAITLAIEATVLGLHVLELALVNGDSEKVIALAHQLRHCASEFDFATSLGGRRRRQLTLPAAAIRSKAAVMAKPIVGSAATS